MIVQSGFLVDKRSMIHCESLKGPLSALGHFSGVCVWT